MKMTLSGMTPPSVQKEKVSIKDLENNYLELNLLSFKMDSIESMISCSTAAIELLNKYGKDVVPILDSDGGLSVLMNGTNAKTVSVENLVLALKQSKISGMEGFKEVFNSFFEKLTKFVDGKQLIDITGLTNKDKNILKHLDDRSIGSKTINCLCREDCSDVLKCLENSTGIISMPYVKGLINKIFEVSKNQNGDSLELKKALDEYIAKWDSSEKIKLLENHRLEHMTIDVAEYEVNDVYILLDRVKVLIPNFDRLINELLDYIKSVKSIKTQNQDKPSEIDLLCFRALRHLSKMASVLIKNRNMVVITLYNLFKVCEQSASNKPNPFESKLSSDIKDAFY